MKKRFIIKMFSFIAVALCALPCEVFGQMFEGNPIWVHEAICHSILPTERCIAKFEFLRYKYTFVNGKKVIDGKEYYLVHEIDVSYDSTPEDIKIIATVPMRQEGDKIYAFTDSIKAYSDMKRRNYHYDQSLFNIDYYPLSQFMTYYEEGNDCVVYNLDAKMGEQLYKEHPAFRSYVIRNMRLLEYDDDIFAWRKIGIGKMYRERTEMPISIIQPTALMCISNMQSNAYLDKNCGFLNFSDSFISPLNGFSWPMLGMGTGSSKFLLKFGQIRNNPDLYYPFPIFTPEGEFPFEIDLGTYEEAMEGNGEYSEEAIQKLAPYYNQAILCPLDDEIVEFIKKEQAGVESVKVDATDATTKQEGIFDVNGVRLSEPPTSGFYIENGEKKLAK